MNKIDPINAMKLTDNIIDWLNNGDRDVASDTVVSTLTNVRIITLGSHPMTYESIGRLIKLMEQEPLIKTNFKYMKVVDVSWKIIAENFEHIEKHFYACEQIPEVFTKHLEMLYSTNDINVLK